MHIVQYQPIKIVEDENGNVLYGTIELEYLAEQATSKVSIDGKTIIPERYNIYGEPIFSKEFAEQCKYNNTISNSETIALIEFNERRLMINKKKFFDTIDGIKNYLTSLNDIHALVHLRKTYLRANPYNELNDFILFGKYLLSSNGNLYEIFTNLNGKYDYPIVCSISDFVDFSSKIIDTDSLIPHDNQLCPCCCQKFTFDDFINSNFDIINNKLCHKSCKETFLYQQRVTSILKMVFSTKYGQIPFDILKKPAPWFIAILFHTPDGDIVVGEESQNEGAKYYIQLQGTFENFNVNEVDGQFQYDDFPSHNRLLFTNKTSLIAYINNVLGF